MERFVPVLKVISGAAGLYMVGVMGFWIFQAAGWLKPAAPVFSTASTINAPAISGSVPQTEQASEMNWDEESSVPEASAYGGSGGEPARGSKAGRFEDLRTEATGSSWTGNKEVEEAQTVGNVMDFAKNQLPGGDTSYDDAPSANVGAAKSIDPAQQNLKKSTGQENPYQNQWGPEFEGDYYPEDEQWDY